MNLHTMYLDHLWPIHRRFAKLAKRCSRCIQSEKAVVLTNGVCNDCRFHDMVERFTAPRTKGTSPGVFCAVMEESKVDFGSGMYVLLSGGKDSCYALTRLVLEGHSILTAIMVDNGFTSKQAIDNAFEVCEKLGVNLIFDPTKADGLKAKMATALHRMAQDREANAYSLVDFTDGAEVFKVGHQIAQSMGAKVIVNGLSREQAKQYGSSLCTESEYGYLVSPLVGWNPSDGEILTYLSRHVGMKAKQFDPVKTNHRMIPVMCALDVKRHGYCSFEKEFAARIRRSEASRLKWLYTFEFLEWATNKGFMDKMIRKELSGLGVKMEDIV